MRLRIGLVGSADRRSPVNGSFQRVAAELRDRGHAATCFQVPARAQSSDDPDSSAPTAVRLGDASSAERIRECDAFVVALEGWPGRADDERRGEGAFVVTGDATGDELARLASDDPGRRSGDILAVLPLALTLADPPPPPPAWTKLTIAALKPWRDDELLVNLILAIGSSPRLRDCVRVRVFDAADGAHRHRLATLARAAGVVAPDFFGPVADHELAWRLRDADAVLAGGHPDPARDYAAVVLALSAGRPVLSERGRHPSIPDDATLPFARAYAIRDMLRGIEAVRRNPHTCAVAGERGRAFAIGRHCAGEHVRRLIPLLEEVVARQPLDEAERQVSNCLATFGLQLSGPTGDRVRGSLTELLPSLNRASLGRAT